MAGGVAEAGFERLIISLVALYIACAVALWVWAPWWAAAVASLPIVLVAGAIAIDRIKGGA